MSRIGTIQVTAAGLDSEAAIAPEIAATAGAPGFIYKNEAHVDAVLQGEIGQVISRIARAKTRASPIGGGAHPNSAALKAHLKLTTNCGAQTDPWFYRRLATLSEALAGLLMLVATCVVVVQVFCRYVLNAGGVTVRIVDLAFHLVGHLRGGLGQANIVTNVMLAGVSGSSTADASATAKLLVPQMEKHGYDRAFSCALTAAASTLANLFPPGLGLIIYAALASVSVGALFVGTIIPGLMMAVALSIVVWLVSVRRGYGGQTDSTGAREKWRSFLLAAPALCLPIMIVGGVRFGVFTATGAGAIAFVFALFPGAFIYRGLSAQNLMAAFKEAVEDTVAVAVIIALCVDFDL